MVVPVGVLSAILGHGIVGKPFSIMSVWGVVALIGILVNDAVVMLDKYNRNLKEGMSMEDAVIGAGKSSAGSGPRRRRNGNTGRAAGRSRNGHG